MFRASWRRIWGIVVALAVCVAVAYQSLVAGSPAKQAKIETVEIRSAEDLAKIAAAKIEQAKLEKEWKRHLIHSSVKIRGRARGDHKAPNWLTTSFESFELDSSWPPSIVKELPRTTSMVEVRAKLWWYPAAVLDESHKHVQGRFPPEGKMPAFYQLSDVEILDASEAGPVPIRAYDVCRSVEIIGELGLPLGTLVDVEGKWLRASDHDTFVIESIEVEGNPRQMWAKDYPASRMKPALSELKITPRENARWKMRVFEMGHMTGLSQAVRKELGLSDKNVSRMKFQTTLNVISYEEMARGDKE